MEIKRILTDHGELDGRSDDDHTQYLLETGARAGSTSSAQDFGATGIKANVIAESGAAAGVTADGVLLKDNGVTASGGLIAPTLKPAADSTSAVQLQSSGGTAIVTLDTTNKITYVTGAVSTAPLGSELIVNGTFATNDFTGWTAGAVDARAALGDPGAGRGAHGAAALVAGVGGDCGGGGAGGAGNAAEGGGRVTGG